MSVTSGRPLRRNCERPLVLTLRGLRRHGSATALIRVLHSEFRSPVDIVTSGPWSLTPVARTAGRGGYLQIAAARGRTG